MSEHSEALYRAKDRYLYEKCFMAQKDPKELREIIKKKKEYHDKYQRALAEHTVFCHLAKRKLFKGLCDSREEKEYLLDCINTPLFSYERGKNFEAIYSPRGKIIRTLSLLKPSEDAILGVAYKKDGSGLLPIICRYSDAGINRTFDTMRPIYTHEC